MRFKLRYKGPTFLWFGCIQVKRTIVATILFVTFECTTAIVICEMQNIFSIGEVEKSYGISNIDHKK